MLKIVGVGKTNARGLGIVKTDGSKRPLHNSDKLG